MLEPGFEQRHAMLRLLINRRILLRQQVAQNLEIAKQIYTFNRLESVALHAISIKHIEHSRTMPTWLNQMHADSEGLCTKEKIILITLCRCTHELVRVNRQIYNLA